MPAIGPLWTTDVTATSARLNAEVNPNGIATSVRFEYLTAAAFQANVAANPPKEGFAGALKAPLGSSLAIGAGVVPLDVNRQISGLQASTPYRFRLVATNADGTSQSPPSAFTTRDVAPVFSLPDARGWEMVSPVDKNGGAIEGPEANFGGGVYQAALGGGAVTYTSGSSFATAQSSPGASQYLAQRGSGAWSTENLTVPALSGSYSSAPDAGAPYQLFSTDLGSALLTNGKRCRALGSACPVANPPLPGSGAPAGYRNYYLRSGAGFQALLTDVGWLAMGSSDFELALAGASADLGQVVLGSCAAITADAVEVPGSEGECDPTATNLYRWSGGGLSLVNLLPGQAQGAPGAALAAASGAISADGSRVYFTQGGNLYLRQGGETVQVDEAQGGGGAFETAAAGGAIAFFSKAGHLYRFDVATDTATDLTPAGQVEGVLGASEDGSRVYYLSAAGIFLRAGAVVTQVAAAAAASNYPPATGSARVSADGSRLAFVSSAPLTGYDNDGNAEVFLYDAGAGTLTCASCNPTGERAQGAATIPGAVANGAALRAYKPRVLSADGARLFFESFDALVSQDTNGDRDVYQWEAQGVGSCQRSGGCVNLISNGRSEGGARFVDASADGADVFFVTDASLVPTDPGSVDLYDARVGGGFAIAPVPIPCVADACQPLPPEPEDPTPGTLLVRPSGNPPLTFPGGTGKTCKKVKKGKKKARRKICGKGKKAKGKKRVRGGSR